MVLHGFTASFNDCFESIVFQRTLCVGVSLVHALFRANLGIKTEDTSEHDSKLIAVEVVDVLFFLPKQSWDSPQVVWDNLLGSLDLLP